MLRKASIAAMDTLYVPPKKQSARPNIILTTFMGNCL